MIRVPLVVYVYTANHDYGVTCARECPATIRDTGLFPSLSRQHDIADWPAAAADLGFNSNVISFSLPECSGSPFDDDRDLSQCESPATRCPDWGDEETTALVSLWADDTVLERFSSMGEKQTLFGRHINGDEEIVLQQDS